MPKIAIIGAGGYIFPLTLIRDILAFETLREASALMDIDPSGLKRTEGCARELIQSDDLPATVAAARTRSHTIA